MVILALARRRVLGGWSETKSEVAKEKAAGEKECAVFLLKPNHLNSSDIGVCTARSLKSCDIHSD